MVLATKSRLLRAVLRPSLLLFLVLSLAPDALAQAWEPKLRIHGSAGYGNVSEDEGSLGSGFVFGGAFGYHFTRSLELAADVSVHRNDRSGGAGRFFHEGHSLTAGAMVLFHFPDTGAQPYVLVGFKWARFDGSRGFAPSPRDPGFERRGTQDFWGPEFGGGLKFFLTDAVALQPEVRLFLGGSGQYEPGVDLIEPGLFLFSGTLGISYNW